MKKLEEKRFTSRLPCSINLELRAGGDERSHTVRAVDISLMGLKFRAEPREMNFSAGENVRLKLNGFRPVDGEIRWTNGANAGVQFTHCLDQVFESWVPGVLSTPKSR